MSDDAPTTLTQLITERVNRSSAREAYRFPRPDGGWESVTWSVVGQETMRLAAGLIALGVGTGDRVAIMSSTRFEWVLAALATWCTGAATTSVYPRTSAGEAGHLVQDSQSMVAIVEDRGQLDKLRNVDGLRWTVLIDGEPNASEQTVLGLAELRRRGEDLLAAQPRVVADRIAAIRPDDLATLLYTSGTTGQPRGVLLPHAAWAYEAEAIRELDLVRDTDLQFLWLPLSHSFGMVLLAAQLAIGFPTAIDGRVDKIVDNVAAVRPTFMAVAPRVLEKIHARIVARAAAGGRARVKLLDWATGVGRDVWDARAAGRRVHPLLSLRYRLADTLVLSKIRKLFGGRLRFVVCGAAPLDLALARWYHAAGVLVLEGYGLTESAAASCLNTPSALRFGTVGRPLPGTTARIAADGEVQLRGPGVMTGYHCQPEASREALDAQGWLHTGDLGQIDPDGFVRITGRKKDLFKTSGGKYVAPGVIESHFLALCPYASQIFVHGAGRNYCTALIALDPDALRDWTEPQGLTGTHSELVDNPEVIELVAGYVDRLNADLNRWETIKKFALLDREFTVDDAELTQSLKVRREVVEKTYGDRLDALYR